MTAPLPGPIEQEPVGIDLATARAMLDAAAADLDLGDYDRQMMTWLAGWDQPTIAVLASIIARGRPPHRSKIANPLVSFDK